MQCRIKKLENMKQGLRDMQDKVKGEFQKEGEKNWAKALFEDIEPNIFRIAPNTYSEIQKTH